MCHGFQVMTSSRCREPENEEWPASYLIFSTGGLATPGTSDKYGLTYESALTYVCEPLRHRESIPALIMMSMPGVRCLRRGHDPEVKHVRALTKPLSYRGACAAAQQVVYCLFHRACVSFP